eukprot:906569-Amphidinium_carterae.1
MTLTQVCLVWAYARGPSNEHESTPTMSLLGNMANPRQQRTTQRPPSQAGSHRILTIPCNNGGNGLSCGS